jgi:hypothetical protein
LIGLFFSTTSKTVHLANWSLIAQCLSVKWV